MPNTVKTCSHRARRPGAAGLSGTSRSARGGRHLGEPPRCGAPSRPLGLACPAADRRHPRRRRPWQAASGPVPQGSRGDRGRTRALPRGGGFIQWDTRGTRCRHDARDGAGPADAHGGHPRALRRDRRGSPCGSTAHSDPLTSKAVRARPISAVECGVASLYEATDTAGSHPALCVRP